MADELPNVNDLARVVTECCPLPFSVLNMIGHVDSIADMELECRRCGHVMRGPMAFILDLPMPIVPLRWVRRIPPLTELESIDIVTEIESERSREVMA